MKEPVYFIGGMVLGAIVALVLFAAAFAGLYSEPDEVILPDGRECLLYDAGLYCPAHVEGEP